MIDLDRVALVLVGAMFVAWLVGGFVVWLCKPRRT